MMQLHNDTWLPDDETHMQGWLSSGQPYQEKARQAFNRACPLRRTVLDVGAHVGLWSRELVGEWERVIAFEPHPAHADCWERNVRGATLHRLALGNTSGFLSLAGGREGNSGMTHVGKAGLTVPSVRLDDLDLSEVDGMKIDVEGYEPEVLQGARQLIAKWAPTICLEQKPHGYYTWDTLAGVDLLRSWGYSVVERVNDDWIMKKEAL